MKNSTANTLSDTSSYSTWCIKPLVCLCSQSINVIETISHRKYVFVHLNDMHYFHYTKYNTNMLKHAFKNFRLLSTMYGNFFVCPCTKTTTTKFSRFLRKLPEIFHICFWPGNEIFTVFGLSISPLFHISKISKKGENRFFKIICKTLICFLHSIKFNT